MVEGAICVWRISRRRMQNPLPSPEFCVRPAPTLNLSMVLVERSGRVPPAAPFALLGGATPPLRKVVQKPLFEVFDEKVYLIRSPTQLMRLIDCLRYHKPTPEEREELNLVSSTERLYLHNLTDLLLACGGRKGFRFTSTDINRLRSVCEAVTKKYETLNHGFENLPLEVTQFRFPPHIKRIEDVADLHSDHDAVVDARNGDQDAVRRRAFQFQRLTRDYIDSYARLRDTATDIRAKFHREDSLTGPIEVLPEPVEAEFEAKAHHPFPSFLESLIQKYHREQRKQTTRWTPACSEPPVDSIGAFCVYLAYVLFQRETLTQDEMSSFEVLLQVLKLSYRVDDKQLCIVDICRPDFGNLASKEKIFGQIVTNTTLCATLYEFLSSVRELRLVNKEKKLLPRQRSRRRIANGVV